MMEDKNDVKEVGGVNNEENPFDESPLQETSRSIDKEGDVDGEEKQVPVRLRSDSQQFRNLSLRAENVSVAFDKAPGLVLGEEWEKKLVALYLLDSINQLGLEQERLLLVAKDALYRVTWSFKKNKVSSISEISFKDIKAVTKGTLRLSKALKIPGKELDSITGKLGIRVFTSMASPSMWQKIAPTSSQHFSTYKVHSPSERLLSPAELQDHHSLEMFHETLTKAVTEYNTLFDISSDDIFREESELVVKAGTGVSHYMYNGADGGRQMDTKQMLDRDMTRFSNFVSGVKGKISTPRSRKSMS